MRYWDKFSENYAVIGLKILVRKPYKTIDNY